MTVVALFLFSYSIALSSVPGCRADTEGNDTTQTSEKALEYVSEALIGVKLNTLEIQYNSFFSVSENKVE